jgi:hypothetical protein
VTKPEVKSGTEFQIEPEMKDGAKPRIKPETIAQPKQGMKYLVTSEDKPKEIRSLT